MAQTFALACAEVRPLFIGRKKKGEEREEKKDRVKKKRESQPPPQTQLCFTSGFFSPCTFTWTCTEPISLLLFTLAGPPLAATMA